MVRYSIVLIFLWQVLLASRVAEAQMAPATKAKFNAYVSKAEGEALKSATLSVYAAEVDSGQEYISHNSSQQMMPASVLKVLTTVAALRNLGANYRFPTEVFIDSLPKENDGRAEAETLATGKPAIPWKAGNLYIRGYGDPSMTSEQLHELVRQIHATGVTRIDNVVIDDTLFANPPSAAGPKPYDAALSAVSLNNNCYQVIIAPNGLGQPAFVEISIGAPLQLQNKVRTFQGYHKNIRLLQSPPSESITQGLKQIRVDNFYELNNTNVSLIVQGNIGVDSDTTFYYQTIPDPAAYYGEVIRLLLDKVGISISGKVVRGTTPASAKLLLVHESKPLTEILNDLNHYSNNFIAGQILFALGQDSAGYFRREHGLTKLHAVLRELGYKPEEFKIVDASGLDRENQLTAEQLVKVLVDAYNDFSIAPDFISSLSRFGATGTLKLRKLGEKNEQPVRGEARLNRKRLADSVWGKTGTIDGVSSIVGYLSRGRGERIAFAIITNGQVEKSSAIEVEDNLIKLLAGLD